MNFRDYIRAEGGDGNPLPDEKIVHLIRPSYRGLRTLCGLGQKHRVWRITVGGVAVNVNGDGWSVCVACCRRAATGHTSPSA